MASKTVEAALNGDSQHPATPRTVDEVVADSVACVAAGANVLHLHAFDDDGAETLAASAVDRVIGAVRSACPGVPLSMTTFAQVQPDPRLRLEQVSRWTQLPDFVPANQGEPGIVELAELFARRGVAVQACVFTVADTESLIRRGNLDQYLRIAVEPMEDDPSDACAHAIEMEDLLTESNTTVEQLHHGMGTATWPVLAQSIDRGHGIRIGLEDTSFLPDHALAAGNTDLIVAALALRTDRSSRKS